MITRFGATFGIAVGVCVALVWTFALAQDEKKPAETPTEKPAEQPAEKPAEEGADKAEEPSELELALMARLERQELPVGTIMPFFGDEKHLANTDWVPCNGGDVSDPGPELRDADEERAGVQTPNLLGRFLRGIEARSPLGATGGEDHIPADEHAHTWARYASKEWRSWDNTGRSITVCTWDDGVGNEGRNTYPIVRTNRSRVDFHTETAKHDHGGENRPRFTSVLYIIKVR